MGLVKTGSVKKIYDCYMFEFSDNYSIFDWGNMPDQIPKKGYNLARTASLLFSKLQDPAYWKNLNKDKFPKLVKKIKDYGINTHYLGQDSNKIYVEPLTVPKISYKEGCYIYSQAQPQTILPLEVIFRFGAPQGSSYLSNKKISPGDKWDYPIINFTTKFESTDKKLTKKSAKEISGLSSNKFNKLQYLAEIIALQLKDIFNLCEIFLWDGKLEFGLDNNNELILVDSIGPDELRLEVNGELLSKQFLRNHYLKSDWHNNVIKSKKVAGKDWKEHCIQVLKSKPASLDKDLINKASKIYGSVTKWLENV